MREKILDFITNYIYKFSDEPVLFRDLIQANALYNDGMYVDPAKLNFRMDFTKAYFVYGILCCIIFVPLIALLHTVFIKLNFHISIIGTIAITSSVFIGFYYFKANMRDYITKKLIMKAWQIHFPYFEYNKYSKEVQAIYKLAQKNEISRKNIEQFVLDRLVNIAS